MNWWENDPVVGIVGQPGATAVAEPDPQSDWWQNDPVARPVQDAAPLPATSAKEYPGIPPKPELTPVQFQDILYDEAATRSERGVAEAFEAERKKPLLERARDDELGRYGKRTPEEYAAFADEVAKRAGFESNPEFVKAVKSTLDVFDLLKDKEGMDKTPPELREESLSAIPYLMKRANDQKREAGKPTLDGAVGAGLGQGILGLAKTNWALKRLNPFRDKEQWEFEGKVLDVASGSLDRPDAGFVSRNVQAAIAAVPKLGAAAAAGGAPGVATMFGVPTAVETEQAAKARGASPAAALAFGVGAGTLETLIFSKIPGRLAGQFGGKEAVSSTVKGIAKKYAAETAKTGGLMTAAGLQARIAEEGAVALSGRDADLAAPFKEAVMSLPDTAFQAGLFHTPGLARGVASNASNALRARVAARDGVPSRSEAKELGAPKGVRGSKPARKAWFEEYQATQETIEKPIEGAEMTGEGGESGATSTQGRPDLANPAVDQPARDFVDKVDVIRNAEGRPETRSDVDVEAEATARLTKDYQAERDRLLQAGRSGRILDDVETVAAKKIVNQEAMKALTSDDPKLVAEAMELVESYRNTGSEEARSFRQRRDPVETPAQRAARMISEAILTPPEKKRAARDKMRRNGNKTGADKINEEEAKKSLELKKKLEGLGVNMQDLLDGKLSPTKTAEALRTIRSVRADNWDKAYEYWNNAILSAPTTQAANLIGNTAHGTWRLTGERLAEATANLAIRDPEAAQFGEFKHMLSGVLPGLSRASKNFLMTWQTEMPTLESQLGREGVQKVEDRSGAIGGKVGRVVRAPWRMLGAADDFAKSLIAEIEVGAYAYRMAKSEGLSGEPLRQRIAELHGDLKSPAWDFAYESALESSFQQKGEGVPLKAKNVALSARKIPGFRYLLPFVNTPANIFTEGVKRTPLGSVVLAKKMWENHQSRQPIFKGLAPRVAQQVLATGVVLALMNNDPDDPWITGAEKGFSREGREEGYRTSPPMSVKIGGQWYSYSRIEPIATVLGMTIDGINSLRSKDPLEGARIAGKGLTGQLTTKTFLTGIGDFFKILSSEKPLEETTSWATRFTTSWIPNIVRSASRESSDTFPQRRVWGKGDERLKLAAKRALQKTELGLGGKDYPIYDVWGRPAQRSESPVGSDWLWRIMVPVKVQKDQTFVADRLILNWNNQHPDEEAVFPRAPEPRYTIKGKTMYMTDAQYAEFCKLAGEKTVQVLSQRGLYKFDPDKPTKRQVEFIGNMIEKSRAYVKRQLILKWRKEAAQVNAAG